MRVDNEAFEDDATLQLAPMIDVIFLLLIFFMVATTFASPEEQIDLELPVAESGESALEQPNELVIDVTEDGRTFVEGAELAASELDELLERTARAEPDTPVTVRGDRNLDYGRVVEVLDRCRVAGLQNAGLRTAES